MKIIPFCKKKQMNTAYLYSHLSALLFVICLTTSCKNQQQQSPNIPKNKLEDSPKVITYGEHDKVTSGLKDKAGNLWFGTSNEGIYRYDGTSFVNFTEQDGLSNNYVNCMVEDLDGNLWFGTKEGLCKYDGKTFSTIQIPQEGEIIQRDDYWWNANTIQCLLIDKNSNLWVGTAGCGAYRYDGKQFTNLSFTNDYKQVDSLHHNFIQSMMEDTDGNIWFTSLTHGGVSRYDGNEVTYFSADDGLKDDMVYSSFQDKSGNLWFGSIQTTYAGLYLYNGKSFTSFGKEDGLCDNFVTGFFEDRVGQLWIRTGSILCLYNGKAFSPFVSLEGKRLKGINFIIEDADQNIWLGGTYGQLWKYGEGNLTNFRQKGQ
jgi:ligand-binding sensor domain-containing protein